MSWTPARFAWPDAWEIKWRRFAHPGNNDVTAHVEPRRAHDDDAGFDLTYSGDRDLIIGIGESADIPCGVCIQLPDQMWGMLIGRSSTFRNRGLLVNTAVIDAGYRGPLFAIVRNISMEPVHILPGERVAQIVPLPTMALGMTATRVDGLSDTVRGESGFGSSGL